MIRVKLKVTDPPQIIMRRMKEAVTTHINDSFKKIGTKIRIKLIPVVRAAILNSPEAKSLRGGELQAELGVIDQEVDEFLEHVTQMLVSTIKVDFIPMQVYKKGKNNGKLTISVLPQDFVDRVIAHPSAAYFTRKGKEIPWATWLLTLGDKIIVRQFQVDYSKPIGSRTGLAIMKPAKRGWRVPPQFSGTKNDNFITRTLDDIQDYILYLFELEVRNSL